MDLSPEKLFMVALIALVVLGPQRLPQAARTAGRALAEAKRLSAGLQAELGDALVTPRKVVAGLTDELNLGPGSGAPAVSGGAPQARPGPSPQGCAAAAPGPRGHSAAGPAPDDPVLN